MAKNVRTYTIGERTFAVGQTHALNNGLVVTIERIWAGCRYGDEIFTNHGGFRPADLYHAIAD